MLELAGNASKDLKVWYFLSPFHICRFEGFVLTFEFNMQVKRITPRHLQLAIRGDEELDTLIKVCLESFAMCNVEILPCAVFSPT